MSYATNKHSLPLVVKRFIAGRNVLENIYPEKRIELGVEKDPEIRPKWIDEH